MSPLDSQFNDYVDDSLEGIGAQNRLHNFNKEFNKLLKKYEIDVRGDVWFKFGNGWWYHIDTKTEVPYTKDDE